jgi:hypothetical protein
MCKSVHLCFQTYIFNSCHLVCAVTGVVFITDNNWMCKFVHLGFLFNCLDSCCFKVQLCPSVFGLGKTNFTTLAICCLSCSQFSPCSV